MSDWNDAAFVYLIKCGKLYKIGKAVDVDKRLKELSTGSAYPLTVKHKVTSLAAGKLESWLHRKFKPWRVRGEWFELPIESTRWFVSKSGARLDRCMARDEICEQCRASEFALCGCRTYSQRIVWAPQERIQQWSRKGELLERCFHCGRWFQSRATEIYCLECRALGEMLDVMGCLPTECYRVPGNKQSVNPALWRKPKYVLRDDELPF